MILATVTALALCRSSQLSATVAGVDRAMHHAYATVVVRNISDAPCAVGPSPAVMLVDPNQQNGQELAVTSPANAPRIDLSHGQTASFVVSWSTMGGPGGSECATAPRDAWLYAGGGGLPLWVPLRASACEPVDVKPYQAGIPAQHGTPNDAQLDDYSGWAVSQPCRVAFLRTEHFDRGPRPDAPAIHDRLAPNLPDAPIAHVATRPDVTVPSVWLDAENGIFTDASEEFGQRDTFVCGRIISIPPFEKRRDLSGVSTAKGVRLGMSAAQVQAVEGRATLHTVAPNTQTLFYRWTSGAGDNRHTITLAFAFWNQKLFAIHYQDAPVHHS